MVDLDLLAPFAQTVSSGSYVAAASRLQVTPSAISKSVLKLEKQLGIRLFNRTTRKLSLTQEGETFHRQIAPLLESLHQAIDRIATGTSDATGRLKVSVTPTIAHYCLFPVIAEFMSAYPAVELDVDVTEVFPNLVEDGVDVCIHHDQGSGTSHVSRVLCDYPAILVASPRYLARNGVPRVPPDLDRHALIGIRLPQRKSSAIELMRVSADGQGGSVGERHVHTPKPLLTIGEHMSSGLIAALYDAGIVPTTTPMAIPYLRSGRLKCVLPEYRIASVKGEALRIYLNYPHRDRMAAKVRAFVNFVVGKFGEMDLGPQSLLNFAA